MLKIRLFTVECVVRATGLTMPRIFISYRRADSQAVAGRIYDRLVDSFGRQNIFKDVDAILLGSEWEKAIKEELRRCDVMLVLIGNQWMTITDAKTGLPRLDNPKDMVRVEVATALRRDNIRVIPVLVDGASLPEKSSLPPNMQALCDRQVAQVRHDPDFTHDMERLIQQIKRPFPRRLVAAAVLSSLAVAIVAITYAFVPVAPLSLDATSTIAVGFEAGSSHTDTPTDTETPSQTPTTTRAPTNTLTPSQVKLATTIAPTWTNTMQPTSTLTDTPTARVAEPTITPTAVSTLTQELRSDATLGAIENPVPLSDTLVIVESADQQYAITIEEAYRGEEAWQRLLTANQFNDRPSTGTEFLLVRVSVRYLKGDIPSKLIVTGSNFVTFSSGYYISVPEAAVPPDPDFVYAELRPTDTDGGWIALQIYSGEQRPLIAFGDLSDVAMLGDFAPTGDIIYFAAYPGNATGETYITQIEPSSRVKPRG